MRGISTPWPLNDDTGRVGLLALESSDPDFLGGCAPRNPGGSLPARLPSRSETRDVQGSAVHYAAGTGTQCKRKFMAMEKAPTHQSITCGALRSRCFSSGSSLLPLRAGRRCGGRASAPCTRCSRRSKELSGKSWVREGQPGAARSGSLPRWPCEFSIGGGGSKNQIRIGDAANESCARDQTMERSGYSAVQTDFWKAELGRTQQLLEKAQLRSPIDGVVATPHVETFVGRKLQPGDSVAACDRPRSCHGRGN